MPSDQIFAVGATLAGVGPVLAPGAQIELHVLLPAAKGRF